VEPYEGRGTIRLVVPYVFLVIAVVASVRNSSPWNGLWWLFLAALSGLTVPWRVRVGEPDVTLWFPFGRRTRYPRAEVVIVRHWGRYRSLALKGRGWWRMYGLPGSGLGVDAAAQAFGYTTLRNREVANFTRRRPKHDEPHP
jgi:hypothetical protein